MGGIKISVDLLLGKLSNMLIPVHIAYLAYLELQRKSYFPQQLVMGKNV